jgi:hypothetical protein
VRRLALALELEDSLGDGRDDWVVASLDVRQDLGEALVVIMHLWRPFDARVRICVVSASSETRSAAIPAWPRSTHKAPVLQRQALSSVHVLAPVRSWLHVFGKRGIWCRFGKGRRVLRRAQEGFVDRWWKFRAREVDQFLHRSTRSATSLPPSSRPTIATHLERLRIPLLDLLNARHFVQVVR